MRLYSIRGFNPSARPNAIDSLRVSLAGSVWGDLIGKASKRGMTHPAIVI